MRLLGLAAAGVLACGVFWTQAAEEEAVDVAPTASTVVSESPQALAAKVHSIFRANCVECHGADLPKPKGKFGYVLDLARVASNPKIVVPAKPLQSELYLLLVDDEMPGKGASSGPLALNEKETIRRWIEAGAPAELPPGATDGSVAGAKAVNRRLTFVQRLIRWCGLFHPPSSHFPMALIIVALPAELMWMLTRREAWKGTVRFCIALGAASAVVTASLGWCAAAFSSYTGASAPVLAWHRWLGTATAAWAVLTMVLLECAHRKGNSPRLSRGFQLTLVVGIVMVSIAGYLGASLIYGLDHFRW